jgi:acyl carrier protein
MTDADAVGVRVRALLAVVLERDPDGLSAMPDNTPLFGSGLSLDSLTGLELLTAIQRDFGVDIAAEDLNLDSLRTIGTLADYLTAATG